MPPETSAAPPDSKQIENTVGPPSRRPRTKLAVGLVAVLLIAAAVVLYFYYRYRESTDDAQVQGHIESVAPRVPGTVTEVDVNDNQIVHAGQVLFRLDDRDYKTALNQAQANLAAARAGASSASTGVPIIAASSSGSLSEAQAGLRQAQSGESLAQSQVAGAQAEARAAQAELAQAQANAANASANEQRYAQLVGKQEVSRQQYDQIATAAKTAAAGVAAAQARVAAAEQEIATASANVQVARDKVAAAAAAERKVATAPQQLAQSRSQAELAQARVAQAEAAVAQAQLNLEYTVVTAPTDGQVGDKHVELGQSYAPGQTALVVVPVNEVWVIANYKETQLGQMRAGQRAKVSVDAFGTSLKATVNSIGAGTGSVFSLLPPENATGNYVKVVQRVPVKLVFDPGQDLSRLRPGMSVEATVFINK
ncbi:MAG TPA: HlyD family secretion protein [Terriglobales bacterium]|nr:HlyD family secretion protein [Terriglobales bacterium]